MKDRLARFIVAHSRLILIAFIVLALGCGALIPFVNINKDMTKYLPKDSAMRHGLDLMKAEFGDETSSTLEIMFDDLKTQEQKDAVLHQLEAMPNAESVDYEAESEDEDHFYNKGKYTRYIINCEQDQYSEEAAVLWSAVREAFVEDQEDRNVVLGGTIHSVNEKGLPLWIIALAVALIALILLIMASSWVEPATFLLTIGIAVLINMGTYVFFPSISNTTFGIVGILQLALSMDYSIMLLNRYRQQRRICADKNETMEKALSLSFSAITGSSLTTFAGLLALVFMSFTMGADIGLALAKGVLISMICIFTVLPALVLGFDSLMLRTAKATPPFDLPRFSALQHKLRLPITLLFAVMLIGSFVLRNGVDFSYSQSWITQIDHVFGHTNTIVMIYDEQDGEAAGQLADSLEDEADIRSAVCYEGTLGKRRIAADMKDFIGDMQEEDAFGADDRDDQEDGSDMDLSASMIKLIYYDYHAGEPTFTLTIPAFVSFLQDEVMTDPDFEDSIDQETRDEIDDMEKFTDRAALTTKRTARGLADFFGMKTSQAEQLLLYYQIKNNRRGDRMTLPGFVDFLINDVAADPEYGKMISKSQRKKLQDMQVYTDKQTITSPLPYADAAGLLGMDEAQTRFIYCMHYAEEGVTSVKTITQTAETLQAMAADPVLSAQFGGEETAQLIDGLNQIGQSDPAPYDIPSMVQTLDTCGMPLDAGTLSLIYAYSDLTADPSLHTISLRKLVTYMLEDDTISASIPADQKKQLARLKKIMDASASGKKLSAKKMGSILGMKSSDVNRIYLLHQYKKGRTGSWKLTPQQFINFLVDQVLTDSSMKSRIGGKASDLKFAKRLINSVVSGRQFTCGQLADFLAEGSDGMDPGKISLLYTLYGSRKEYDEAWTMNLVQMVTHLDEDMLTRPAFADSMDEEDMEKIHDTRADMDEAEDLLKTDHYGRMVITALMEEDSDETRAFMDDLTARTDSSFQGDTYFIGNTPMAYEMSRTFRRELNKITLITALFILLIVLLTFRRLAAPVILVLIIQCAVFLTMALLNCLHVDMQYLALLIVQSIMMGATIDYAIIYTTYYLENRAYLDPKEAIRAAFKGSLQTILTSATILIAAVGVLSFAFADPSVREICRILSVGSLIATVLVIFILPGILACLDRIVFRQRKAP